MAERSLAAVLLERWRGSMSQTKAAHLLGVDQGRYSQFERGARKPGLKIAGRIQDKTQGAVPMTAWFKPAQADDADDSPAAA